ncbi:amidase [Aliiglaciecola sp. 3_MG-2023]|uniref:amidase n=1 Tax=Aliiglaciecola sp. 3_MG-2023 TaxID=3062644 RepID=UPI0026E38325|nr:amidase [Aliiglaciecola sp. 3_MG-2023]MDO6693155.1 amidase [Aliiglaciecola sp. 3_MG-2023]
MSELTTNKTINSSRRAFMATSGKLGAALITTSLGAGAFAKTKLKQSTSITELSASSLSKAIKSRQVSCVEVMQAYLSRIEKYNPIYNAIVSLRDSDELLAQAKTADAALAKGEYHGWMHGMPHAVKDLSDVTGIVTTSGSPILKSNLAKADTIFVERLRKQGAIFIGKTNVPEFGLGSQSYNSVFGVTRNAYNPALCAGGSSGGAASALALQLLPVADGSDMMGSLRNPAAYNNVIGFRPSQGRVPYKDKNGFYQQLGYEGSMGRNVEDTRLLLETMAGYDARVPLSLRDSLAASRPANLSEFKVGWMGDYDGHLEMEPGILDMCTSALSGLNGEGLVVEDCIPNYDFNRLWQTWLTLRHWTIAGGAKGLYDNPKFRALMKPEAVWEIEGGLDITGLEVYKAGMARTDWYNSLSTLFSKYDFLALPSAQVFAFDADLHWPKKINQKSMESYHHWMEVVVGGTLSGCPVINLPVGFDAKGRAMGIQVMAPMGEDAKLLDFAAAYEAKTDYLSIRPSLS